MEEDLVNANAECTLKKKEDPEYLGNEYDFYNEDNDSGIISLDGTKSGLEHSILLSHEERGDLSSKQKFVSETTSDAQSKLELFTSLTERDNVGHQSKESIRPDGNTCNLRTCFNAMQGQLSKLKNHWELIEQEIASYEQCQRTIAVDLTVADALLSNLKKSKHVK